MKKYIIDGETQNQSLQLHTFAFSPTDALSQFNDAFKSLEKKAIIIHIFDLDDGYFYSGDLKLSHKLSDGAAEIVKETWKEKGFKYIENL